MSNVGFLISDNTFDAFRHENSVAQKQTVSTIGIDKPTIQTQNQSVGIPSNEANDEFLKTKDNKKNKWYKALLTTVLTTGTIASFAVIFSILTKGKMTKTVAKKLGDFTNKISQKIEMLKQQMRNSENSKLHPVNIKKSKIYLSFLQKTNKGLMMARGFIFNTTPLKDVLFKKIVCDKLKLKKPCDAITNGFRKLSLSTVKTSYSKVNKNANNMTSLFAETNKALESGTIVGAKPVSKETMTVLNEKISKISEELNKNFSEKAILERDKSISKICKNLSNRVYDRIYGNLKHFLKDVKSMTTFIPEMLIEKDKSKFLKSILKNKRKITNNPLDNYKQINEAIARLEHNVNPADKASRELIGSLKKLAKEYVNLSGSTEKLSRVGINEQINSVLKQSKNVLKRGGYSSEEVVKIKSQLNEIGRVVNTDKKGLIEEVLSVYKEVLPADKYKELKLSAQKTINKINNATIKEGSEYVDKVRDLSNGSALTDVAFSLALPLGSTAIAMSTASTKEKKQSVALKYGIPILSGAITSMLATVKLVSGGKALALGLGSTFITNQICKRIDNKLKENSAKKLNA